ncbi:Lytic transglycosylase catalytic [Sphingobium herbicidovorans NBRC 16415]|uniref:Lytic transglycosylase catalytic n=1 Tax=Sphingobium herbicidovorans (strain ATCC 700291 / DSM 11019 / CCUG 56400 / KCTC 2939 / LMG 18315 / NBRC 16415 / MH) TaxID=1219045 RepID=A0A086P5F0_SPHHM|nr:MULTISPECIES: lytic transglycosylase domain-containing protein [Sphingomonadaceae]KFG88618.1 Lytic transglycosylase catalytic [Sphingobium herbicidovorans NBRC 16415]
MGALRRRAALLAVLLSFAAGPCFAREGAPWRDHVTAAAARFGLPEEWVLRVIAAESGGRTELGGRPITSHAGAMGLMQVMPATWASLRARYRLGPDPHDPRDNIVAGTAYLRDMYDRFGYPGLFAAYNAGPGRYGEHLARGRPLPRETRDYVAKITGQAALPRAVVTSARPTQSVVPHAHIDSIFFALSERAGPAAPETTPQAEAPAAINLVAPEQGAARADPLFLLRSGGDDKR